MNAKSAHDELKEWGDGFSDLPQGQLIRRAVAEYEAVKEQMQSQVSALHGASAMIEAKLYSQLNQAVHERDEAESALAQAYEMITGNPPEWSNNFSFNDALNDISCSVKERDQLKAEFDASERRGAEMRGALKSWVDYFQCDVANNADQSEQQGEQFTDVWFNTEHALGSDCGKGYASPEQVRVLKELIVKAHSMLHCGVENPAADAIKQAIDLCKKL